MSVTRFGVSLEEDLLIALDDYVRENQFANRSQAIRQIISKNIVEKKWKCNNIVAGAVVLVYSHSKGEIMAKSAEIQHQYLNLILSSQHFNLTPENILEIIAVKGEAANLTELSDKLIGIKGIQHGKLIMSRVD